MENSATNTNTQQQLAERESVTRSAIFTPPSGRKLVSLFGSCVTRDAFELTDPNFEVNSFVARSTIRSLVSDQAAPIDFDDLALNDPTIYRKRFVVGDLSKNVFEDIAQRVGDVMIIDLTSEIIPTMRFRGSIVTASDYFQMLVPPEEWRHLPQELAGTPEIVEETVKLIPVFVQQFLDLYGEERVLLHEAVCATQFFDGNRLLYPFDERTLETVKRLNYSLERYYSEIKRYCPGIRSIRVSKNNIYGDSTHKWGLSFFHYVPEYYQEFRYKLQRIMAML